MDTTLGGRLAPVVLGGTSTCMECGAVVANEAAKVHVDWHDWQRQVMARLFDLVDPPGC